MQHNDVIRAVRHILNVRDQKLLEIIHLANTNIKLEDLLSYLKNDDEAGFIECDDLAMAAFLDGLVYFKRGKDETRPKTPTHKRINNNIILKRLKTAFEFKDDDIIKFIQKSGHSITKGELSAFFRSSDHRNYRVCGDQFLRNLLKGMSL